MKAMCLADYERMTAATRDSRMAWWREARFGMFVHYGLFSQIGRHEWCQAQENIPIDEYAKLAGTFDPKPGLCREWAKLAAEAGMKYMVLTTRHHEGFSLWDSKANSFNSVNACGRDIVREFVDACREFGLKVGLYNSLMDFHHPDGWRCAFDLDARTRFVEYFHELNRELLTNYGKIDVIWFDGNLPLKEASAWNPLQHHMELRMLQPDIIINNRDFLPEDYGTPEEKVKPEGRDWEACMTFNNIAWGYLDEEQTADFALTPKRILRMLNTCCQSNGNLLLNIGPAPDGSVPKDAGLPLQKVGEWIRTFPHIVYGDKRGLPETWRAGGNGVTSASPSQNGLTAYLWSWIWPRIGWMSLSGYDVAPVSARLLPAGTPVQFEHRGNRLVLTNLSMEIPDAPCDVNVIELTFPEFPHGRNYSYYPQFFDGEEIVERYE